MGEIESLIERAHTYLRSARLLHDAKDFESPVSRSYYAMFFLAEAALLSKGLAFSSHKSVIAAFGEHFVKTTIASKDLGRELHRAFEMRQLGDYEFRPTISRDEAEGVLMAADRFVATVENYLHPAK